MIRARSAKPCAVLRREASDVNSRRSTSSSSSGAKRRPITNPPQMRGVRHDRVDLESAELQIQDTGWRSYSVASAGIPSNFSDLSKLVFKDSSYALAS